VIAGALVLVGAVVAALVLEDPDVADLPASDGAAGDAPDGNADEKLATADVR
jgi:hypothetical protein